MQRTTALWVVIALLGLVVAAGVTAAASRLSSQHVGLSSEPLSAGDRLAPRSSSPPRTVRRKPARSAPARRQPSRQAAPAPSGGGSTNVAPTTTLTAPPPAGGEQSDGSGDGGRGDD